MTSKIKRGFVLLVILMIVGCASTQPPGKLFSETVKPLVDKDKALIYIYRVGQNSPIIMGFVKVYINNEFVFSVADHGFTWITVEPGIYQFKASWPLLSRPKSIHMLYNNSIALPFDRSDKAIAVEVKAGNTYFINYSTRQGMVFTDDSERYQVLAVVASMEAESEYYGLIKLETCGFQKNEYKP